MSSSSSFTAPERTETDSEFYNTYFNIRDRNRYNEINNITDAEYEQTLYAFLMKYGKIYNENSTSSYKSDIRSKLAELLINTKWTNCELNFDDLLALKFKITVLFRKLFTLPKCFVAPFLNNYYDKIEIKEAPRAIPDMNLSIGFNGDEDLLEDFFYNMSSIKFAIVNYPGIYYDPDYINNIDEKYVRLIFLHMFKNHKNYIHPFIVKIVTNRELSNLLDELMLDKNLHFDFVRSLRNILFQYYTISNSAAKWIIKLAPRIFN